MQSFRQITIRLSPLVFRLTYSYAATILSLKLLDYSNLADYHFNPNWGLLSGILLLLVLLTLLMSLELRREKISAFPIKTAYLLTLASAVLLKVLDVTSKIEVPSYLYQISIISVAFGFYLLYWFDFSSLSQITTNLPQLKRSFIFRYWHWYTLAAIVILGIILRTWNLDYLQGTDNFNILAARALKENGAYFYEGNRQITHIVAWLFSIFGQSWQVARIPMVIFGAASVWLIFYLGSYVNKNVGLISAFLLAISPVAIEKSSFVREYSETMFWGLGASLILLKVFTKFKHEPAKFIRLFPLILVSISVILYFYSVIFNSTGIRSNLALIIFMSIPLIYEFLRINFPSSSKYFFAILLPCLYLFQAYAYLPLNIFIKGFQFQPYWAQMFFNPEVTTPMQWFSKAGAPEVFLLMLFFLPAFVLYRKRELLILYFVFICNIFLFMFKYNAVGYYHSRYLYYLMPVFVVIFAAGLYSLFTTVIYFKQRVLVSTLISVFVLSFIVIPLNSIHAAKHDLSIWENKDERQPTASGSRDGYLNLINFLEQQGLTNKDAVAIQGDDQFYITWYFDYPVTKKFSYKYSNGAVQNYDFGNKLYLIDPYKNVDELDMALHENQTGFLIGHSSNYAEESFDYWKYHFSYLGSAENYKVYWWSPRTPSASDSKEVTDESLETAR